MSEGDVTVMQGLQGANATIAGAAGPQGPSGIEELELLDATLVFNQENGTIVLQGADVRKISGEVLFCDVNGRVLGRTAIHEGLIDRLNIGTQPSGIYLITIITSDQKQLTKKITF